MTTTIDPAKRLATLRAELALRGFELRPRADGGWLIVRWGLTRDADDLVAVEAFLQRVGARQ